MRTSALLLVGSCCVGLLSSGCGGSQDSPPGDVGRPTRLVYQMNEKPGGNVMRDSGRAGVDGRIGPDIMPGARTDGATGYQFPSVDPSTTAVRPGHLATIPDGPDVDPGEQDYAVEIRYRTRQANGANLVQKGQSQSSGGQFKIQVPEGNPQCYYKGARGKVGATSPTRINDGAWHILRCVRTASTVSLYVDGALEKRHQGATGDIDNSLPMTIGGKSDCNMTKVQCDYFGGTIDYLKITKG